MARKQQRRNQQPTAATPIDWTAAEAQARRDLKRNAQAIQNTPRGTPGAKPPTWRLGRSPSSTPADR
ncbi:MAG: hypothetical protein ACR2P2_18780 [Nakamurella sp.]